MEIKKILTQILEEGFGILYANPNREIKITYSEGILTMKKDHQTITVKFKQPEFNDWSPGILSQLFKAISAAADICWDDCTNYHKYFCGQCLSLTEVLYDMVSYATLAKLGNLVYTPSDHLLEELYCNLPEEADDDIFQVFIIDKPLYDILEKYTNEYICYSETTETFLWGITHAHTNWEYVFTEIEI